MIEITNTSEKHINVNIRGRFDYSMHSEFRDVYKDRDLSGKEITIDFSGAEYIDSAALGMLMLLREAAGGESAQIELRHCRENVRKILQISNFDRLFTVS